MSVKDDTRVNPEPVAPPSPDIAGLVERATKGFVIGTGKGVYDAEATDLLRDLATALQRVAQERDAAIDEANDLQTRLYAAEARLYSGEGLNEAASEVEDF